MQFSQMGVCKKNDDFLEDDISAAAADLADVINTEFSGIYEAQADGNTVTVRAIEIVDGQELIVRLAEGVQRVTQPDSDTMSGAVQDRYMGTGAGDTAP